MNSLKIYIAGPYTGKNEKKELDNTNCAIDAGIKLFKMGHFPYIPHLTHFVDIRAKEKKIFLQWEDYIKWDIEWLKLCDALLYLGKSKGADIELEIAKKLKKLIFYSLNEISHV